MAAARTSAIALAVLIVAVALRACEASSATAAISSMALRERAARTGILPSLSSLFDSAKDKAKEEVNKLLPALSTLRSQITDPIRNGINSAETTAKNTLKQAVTDTQNWVNNQVNTELGPMLTAVENAKTGLVGEIGKVKTMAANMRNSLEDLVKTLDTMVDRAFTLNVNPNCPLPGAIVQTNNLIKDYLGISDIIPQEKWCTAMAVLEKLGGSSKSTGNLNSIAAPAAGSFLEKVSRLHKINLHSTDFMAASAGTGLHIRVGGQNYACPNMLYASDIMDGGVAAIHLLLSGLDTNKDKGVQKVAGIIAIVTRLASTVMRSMCAAKKNIVCSPANT